MSREYLNYLIRKRAIVFGFFAISALGISIAWAAGGPLLEAMRRGSQTAAFLSLLMAYIFPLIQFSYVHRKSAADRFFALPISRTKQLVTELVFLFGICAACYLLIMVILYLMYGIGYMQFVRFLQILAAVLLSLLEAVLISSCMYLLGNTVFDGIVLSGAYMFLPVAAAVVFSVFGAAMVAGNPGFDNGPAYLLSPAALAFRLISHVQGGEAISVGELLLGIVYALLACFGLYRNYVQRKTERAEQLSDSLFAYPFILHIYAAAVLFCYACNTVSDSPDYILYLILFVIYIIAQFVYKRKIELRPVYLAIFAGLLALTHITAYAGWKTHGFGRAETLSLPDEKILTYHYLAAVKAEDLGQRDPEGRMYADVLIDIPKGQEDKYREAIDILEGYRKKAIDWFYEKSVRETGSVGTLNLYGRPSVTSYSAVGNLWYELKEPLSEEELIRLSEYGNVQILDTTTDEPYSLSQYLEKRR